MRRISPLAPIIGFITISVVLVTNTLILKLISDELVPVMNDAEKTFVHHMPLLILIMGIFASISVLAGILQKLGANRLFRK